MSKSVVLSSFGLKYILQNNLGEESEFKFIFGKEEIKMNKIFAEFLSPAVSHLHQCDPTINSINYETFNAKESTILPNYLNNYISKNVISQLQNVYNGYPLEIKSDEAFNFRILSILLGNEELYNKINEIYPMDFNSKNADQLIEELQIYQFISHNFQTFPSFNFELIIDHISSQFESISHQKLMKLSKPILYSILSNNNRITDDDKIDFIHEIFNNNVCDDDDDYEFNKSRFYETIEFSKLSKAKLSEFFYEYDYNKMTRALWFKLIELILTEKEEEVEAKEEFQAFEFKGNSNRFEGIINYLTQKFSGNVAKKGIVGVTSSSTLNEYVAERVVAFDSKDYFISETNSYDQWIKYDFKQMKIRPTHYSIRTRDNTDCGNLQSWVIEVSNNDRDDDWKIVDSRSGVTSIMGQDQSDTFEINTKLSPNEKYRYIRLRQTGKSTNDRNYLSLSALEYYGQLFENSQNK